MATERRRFRRYDVTGVDGILVFNLRVQVVDLSLTGMSVEAPGALKSGAIYTVSVEGATGRLRFPAIVRWCNLVATAPGTKGDVAPVYRAGLDFRDALDESARQLFEFIRGHIVVELERRLAGRFTVREGEEFAIGARGEFVVRKLSLSGMLIHTAFVPDSGAVLELELRHPVAWKARARVAYVELVKNEENVVQVGLEFLDASPEATAAIQTIIDNSL